MKQALTEFFGSKKVKVFLIGVLALAAKELLGLEQSTVAHIVTLATTYIIGQSVVDVALAAKGKK